MNLEEDNLDYELHIQDDDLVLNDIPNVSECRNLLKQFKLDGFWPNVYHVNDHGNVDLLRIGWNGARIIQSWV